MANLILKFGNEERDAVRQQMLEDIGEALKKEIQDEIKRQAYASGRFYASITITLGQDYVEVGTDLDYPRYLKASDKIFSERVLERAFERVFD